MRVVSVPAGSSAFTAARARLAGRFEPAAFDPWWEALPALLTWVVEAWGVELGDAVGHGETAVVLPGVVRGSGDRVFVKLTPDPRLTEAEARALDHWATTGRVPLVVERAVSRGALLLSALPAARSLRETCAVPEPDAIASLTRELHGVPPAAGLFPPLLERTEFLFDLWDRRLGIAATPGLPEGGGGLLARGRALAAELADDAPLRLLIHGDLHPGNVFDLGSPVGLAALDPRPCVGDPGFDLIDWVVLGSDDPADWRRRAALLAELTGTSADRTWAWCTAFGAMLAAIEGARGGSARRVAGLLEIAA